MLIINELLADQVIGLLEDADKSSFNITAQPGAAVGISFKNEADEAQAEVLLKDSFGPGVILGSK